MEPGSGMNTGTDISEASVSPEIRSALEQNSDLREALKRSGMPLDFQAMVLGLTTIKQLNQRRRGRS